MRMSRGVTVTLLSGLLLTACLTTRGCGRRSADYTWYDKNGNRIAENWKTDASGKRVPDPYPYDRYGRPWVYDENDHLVPQEPPAGSRRTGGGLFFFGGSGYRSGSSGSGYRSGGESSSISRGGFGSTGHSGG